MDYEVQLCVTSGDLFREAHAGATLTERETSQDVFTPTKAATKSPGNAILGDHCL